MTPIRVLLMALGLTVFVVGAYLVFFEAGLDRWLSIGILTAGIVLFVGLLLMSFASGTPADEPPTREVHREVVHEHEPTHEHVVHHHRD